MNGANVDGVVFRVTFSIVCLCSTFAKQSSVNEDVVCLQYGSYVVQALNPFENNLKI